jgi:hypothetical protein
MNCSITPKSFLGRTSQRTDKVLHLWASMQFPLPPSIHVTKELSHPSVIYAGVFCGGGIRGLRPTDNEAEGASSPASPSTPASVGAETPAVKNSLNLLCLGFASSADTFCCDAIALERLGRARLIVENGLGIGWTSTARPVTAESIRPFLSFSAVIALARSTPKSYGLEPTLTKTRYEMRVPLCPSSRATKDEGRLPLRSSSTTRGRCLSLRRRG